MKRLVLFALAALAAVMSFALWPVCVALTPDQVAAVQPSIAERTDIDVYLRVFQQRNGQWYQCKTRMSRALFF